MQTSGPVAELRRARPRWVSPQPGPGGKRAGAQEPGRDSVARLWSPQPQDRRAGGGSVASPPSRASIKPWGRDWGAPKYRAPELVGGEPVWRVLGYFRPFAVSLNESQALLTFA